LRSPAVIAIRADWTRPAPTVSAYLQSFGRCGVPPYVVPGRDAPDGLKLPELLTPEAVMDAFWRAGTGGGSDHGSAIE
jgi:suppressor for copper-sensitivity B